MWSREGGVWCVVGVGGLLPIGESRRLIEGPKLGGLRGDEQDLFDQITKPPPIFFPQSDRGPAPVKTVWILDPGSSQLRHRMHFGGGGGGGGVGGGVTG